MPECSVIGSRIDCRENQGHGLCGGIQSQVAKISDVGGRTTKLILVATRTTELAFFVPPAQGTPHCPEEPSVEQSDPGPATRSYPAAKA